MANGSYTPPARGSSVAGYLLAFAGITLLWHIIATVIDIPALPPPVSAFSTFLHALRGELKIHLGVSSARVIASTLIALCTALPLGLVLGRMRRVDEVVSPALYLLYPIPKIVLLPVVLVLLGSGNASKIFLISVIVFFQIVVTTRDAARSVSTDMLLSISSLGASEKDIYLHVLFPAVLPKVFTSLRIALGTAIAVLFIAETFVTRFGLGYYLIDAWSRYDFPSMYAGILAMGLLGLVLYLLLDWGEKRVCRWQDL